MKAGMVPFSRIAAHPHLSMLARHYLKECQMNENETTPATQAAPPAGPPCYADGTRIEIGDVVRTVQVAGYPACVGTVFDPEAISPAGQPTVAVAWIDVDNVRSGVDESVGTRIHNRRDGVRVRTMLCRGYWPASALTSI